MPKGLFQKNANPKVKDGDNENIDEARVNIEAERTWEVGKLLGLYTDNEEGILLTPKFVLKKFIEDPFCLFISLLSLLLLKSKNPKV